MKPDQVQWARAERICSHGGQPLLFNKIEPNDVCQGAVGDCWLMAAISAVAEFPCFIEQVRARHVPALGGQRNTTRLCPCGESSTGQKRDSAFGRSIMCAAPHRTAPHRTAPHRTAARCAPSVMSAGAYG